MIVCDSVPGPRPALTPKSWRTPTSSRGMMPPRHGKVGESSLLQFFRRARDQCHVRSRQNRQPDNVDIFLQRGLGHHCRRLAQPRVDDLHAGVAKRRATTLAPRSWPSGPGLAINTRIISCHVATSPTPARRYRVRPARRVDLEMGELSSPPYGTALQGRAAVNA